MTTNIDIHETAFMTSMFRSMNEDLSKDYYSMLWNTMKTKRWVDDYLQEVSQEEVKTHCIRNRYFLETLKNLCSNNKVEVLINFGSGFSMYPFLLDSSLAHIEIDKPAIVNYKQDQLTKWMHSGELPKREISFIGIDFTQDYTNKLWKDLKEIKGTKKSLILIEGVLFFLKESETIKLFDFFESIQDQGEYIGSVSYRHNIKQSKVFNRLLDFFNNRLEKTTEADFLTLEDRFYKENTAYKLVEVEDYFSYSKKINNQIQGATEKILNEHFYVLQKI